MIKFIKNIFIFCTTFLLVIGIVDLYMKYAGVIRTSPHEYVKGKGIDFRKATNMIYFNEGFSIQNYNSNRIKGKETSILKKENTFRISILGDSFVQASQVFERDHFATILKEHLSGVNPDGKTIEILNFGFEGSEIEDIYTTYELKVKPYKSDLTIVMFELHDLKIAKGDLLNPKLNLINDSLQISLDFDQTHLAHYKISSFLRTNSTFINMLSNCNTQRLSNGFLPKLLDKFYLVENKKPHKKEVILTLTPMVKKTLQTLNAENVLFVYRNTEKLPKDFFNYVSQKNFISLSPLLLDFETKGFEPNYWKATKKHGHWNIKAHEYIGHYLAKELIKKGLYN